MIGKLLRLYRAVNNLSNQDLAATIGVSPATLSRIENGKEFDSRTMIKLIEFLFKSGAL